MSSCSSDRSDGGGMVKQTSEDRELLDRVGIEYVEGCEEEIEDLITRFKKIRLRITASKGGKSGSNVSGGKKEVGLSLEEKAEKAQARRKSYYVRNKDKILARQKVYRELKKNKVAEEKMDTFKILF